MSTLAICRDSPHHTTHKPREFNDFAVAQVMPLNRKRRSSDGHARKGTKTLTGSGMHVTTRELPDHETLAAVFRSAKIEPWQTGLDAASLAACEKDIHPDDRARFRDALRSCLAGGGECAFQYRAIGSDGNTRHFESHVRLIRDSAGAPSRIGGIRRDVHQLKHLQKVTDAALSHTSLSELLDDLLPKICDAMSADASIVFLADHERQELYSLTGFARNGLAAPPQARLPFGESFAGRVAVERRFLTLRQVTSDPTVRPQARAFGAESAAGVPLLSGQRLVGVLVVASRADRQFCRDETNLLELVGQRLTNAIVNSSLYEDARDANRIKDRFLSVASHELRAPITGILGWISLLRTETDPGICAEALDWIEQSARTQAQLVSDLLDMTRIREGKLELRRETIDVRDAVQTAIRVVEAQARERGVIIETSMPEQPVTITGDATRLQQVVWNLLGNAVKFTPAGKHVRASVEATGSAARITVADEGEGIKPEFLAHVFNAFEQDTNGKRAGGLGLGLHIVSTIVSMHGGTIEAMSDGPGRGAAFAVTLPVGAAA